MIWFFLGQIISLHVWKQEKNFFMGEFFFKIILVSWKCSSFTCENMQSQMFCGRIFYFFHFCVNYETNEITDFFSCLKTCQTFFPIRPNTKWKPNIFLFKCFHLWRHFFSVGELCIFSSVKTHKKKKSCVFVSCVKTFFYG